MYDGVTQLLLIFIFLSQKFFMYTLGDIEKSNWLRGHWRVRMYVGYIVHPKSRPRFSKTRIITG